MLLLTVSDRVSEILYTDAEAAVERRIDAIVSCGDLPAGYLDFLASRYNAPLLFVRGNHANFIESESSGPTRTRINGVDLHRRSVRIDRISLAGIEGCVRYNQGRYQYTQNEMWLHAIRLIPSLLRNRLRWGRFLDVLVTHTPPWGINDQDDPAHQGARAFLWLLRTFKPRYHFHGHVHLYRPSTPASQTYCETLVMNTFGHQTVEIP